jgi:hypothetical protein
VISFPEGDGRQTFTDDLPVSHGHHSQALPAGGGVRIEAAPLEDCRCTPWNASSGRPLTDDHALLTAAQATPLTSGACGLVQCVTTGAQKAPRSVKPAGSSPR